MSDIPPKNSNEQTPQPEPERQNSGGNNPNGPPADLTALINAIKEEGRAYRREEQREDNGKRFREWITIGLLVATLGVFSCQLKETIKAYGPLKDQAEAAKDTAIAGARAWVGPYQAKLIEPLPQPSIEKDWKIEIDYQNTGREPARQFTPYFDTFIQPIDDDYTARIQKDIADCKSRRPTNPSEVVYPVSIGLGGGGYQRTITIERSKLNQVLLEGQSAVVVSGCFVYITRDTPKYSTFCFFFREGQTKPEALNICFGADAD